MRASPVAAIAAAWLAACSFDASGVTTPSDDDSADDDGGDDDDAPDARPDDGNDPDAAPTDHDGDDDGVDDADDVCPEVPDPQQGDEDGDGLGDVCDGCPHLPDPEQPDGDDDGVDDDCDPSPEVPGDTIAFFDGFHGNARAAAWKVGTGSDTWTVAGDALVQSAADRQIKVLYLSGFSAGDVLVETAVTFTDIPSSSGPTDNVRSAGVVTGLGANATFGRLAIVGDLIRSEFAAFACADAMTSNAEETGVTYEYFQSTLEEARYLVRGYAGFDEQGVIAVDPDGTVATASTGAPTMAGAIGLRTRNVAASYAYVIAYGHD